MRLDPATFLLQWATGGLLFGWVTTRHRIVGLGYGWLIRITFGLLALGGAGVGLLLADSETASLGRDLAAVGVFLAAAVALAVSVVRRKAGVSGQRAQQEQRKARVAAMIGADPPGDGEALPRDGEAAPGAVALDGRGREFPPALDLVAPAIGLVGLVIAATVVGGGFPLALARLVAGALFLGAVTDAMLLGHWYLVQPGLTREPIKELVRWTAVVFPFEIVALLWPPGMWQVLDGTIDDQAGGIFGWIWVTCAVTTIALVGVTWAALKERSYSAVMAATGLLYLAILTAFGTDLVARAVLNP